MPAAPRIVLVAFLSHGRKRRGLDPLGPPAPASGPSPPPARFYARQTAPRRSGPASCGRAAPALAAAGRTSGPPTSGSLPALSAWPPHRPPPYAAPPPALALRGRASMPAPTLTAYGRFRAVALTAAATLPAHNDTGRPPRPRRGRAGAGRPVHLAERV